MNDHLMLKNSAGFKAYSGVRLYLLRSLLSVGVVGAEQSQVQHGVHHQVAISAGCLPGPAAANGSSRTCVLQTRQNTKCLFYISTYNGVFSEKEMYLVLAVFKVESVSCDPYSCVVQFLVQTPPTGNKLFNYRYMQTYLPALSAAHVIRHFGKKQTEKTHQFKKEKGLFLSKRSKSAAAEQQPKKLKSSQSYQKQHAEKKKN